MLWRTTSIALNVIQIVVWHALFLSLAAFHLDASLCCVGVILLMRIVKPSPRRDPLLLICRFYSGLSGCLGALVVVIGTVAVALMFIVSSLRGDAELQQASFRLVGTLFYVILGFAFFEGILIGIREFIEGPYSPTIPGREAKEIPRRADYNAAELEALKRGRRTGGAGR